MSDVKENISEKVVRYEQFLNETLKPDLKRVLEERDQIYEQLSEYLQLRTTIEHIKESELPDGKLTTQVDLGCNFYVKAKIPDTSHICVSIGYGFYLNMTLDEALRFIGKKEKQLNESAEKLTLDSAKIKAHIKFVLEGLREIQNIANLPEKSSQRDIFA